MRLCDSVSSPQGRTCAAAPLIGLFDGEGVGPEVIRVALDALQALSVRTGRGVQLRVGGAIGKPAVLAHGVSLTPETVRFCEEIFAAGGALFCGPAGARFVYDLRRQFGLFCKFTPLQPMSALHDCGAVRPERLAGVDIIAVRENVGGLYFGHESTGLTAQGDRFASHLFSYDTGQIMPILSAAASLAQRRSGRLTLVIKREGTPAISQLWLDCLQHTDGIDQLDVQILDIDNAVYQLVNAPQQFDVIVSPNMFGDVLADCGALLLGSRGMSYSGNFSADGKAVFQTGHGAAHDIAGLDQVNPFGQVMALAMLLEEHLGWADDAALLRRAVATVLAAGLRSADLAAAGAQVLGTRALGAALLEAIARA
jgi:3-isopropylmalate dehydrogenase